MAVQTAVAALRANPGDEIITTPATDIGSVIGVLQNGLIPVFCDWAPGTFNMSATDIERRITSRTRAILVIHLFGLPCDMTAIMEVADRHDLSVIEDCAQAHLAEHNGKKVGSFGEMSCFSFGLKTLTTNQGGMVAAADADNAARQRGYLSKGSEKVGDIWTPYSRIGTFAPMTDLQTAVGLAQIARLVAATRAREVVAAHMHAALSQIACITLPETLPGDRSVHYLIPYHFDEAIAGIQLQQFIEALRAEGISDAFGPYLKGQALHRHPLFLNATGFGTSGFPFRGDDGIPRIDYASLRLPQIDAIMPGLGFFHMRNSFTQEDGADIETAITKVARGFGLLGPRNLDGPRPLASMVRPEATLERAARHDTPPTDPAPSPTPERSVLHAFAAADDVAPQLLKPASVSSANTGAAVFDVTAFGAIGDGSAVTAEANDLAFERLFEECHDRSARIILPRGRFVVSQPWRLIRQRILKFIGQGVNAKNFGTRIITDGQNGQGLLDLASCVHCQFEGIHFDGSHCNDVPVVQTRCDTDGPDGLSALSIRFDDCTFQGPEAGVCVALRDSANIDFDHCWFTMLLTAVTLGVAIGGVKGSISNRLVNTVTFQTCLFFGFVRGIRASCVKVSDSMFSERINGAGTGLDFGDDPMSRVTHVSINGCFAIRAQSGAFFRQGAQGFGWCSRITALAAMIMGWYWTAKEVLLSARTCLSASSM